jgi:hypothetical protein
MRRSNLRIIDGNRVMLGDFTFFYHTGDLESEGVSFATKAV